MSFCTAFYASYTIGDIDELTSVVEYDDMTRRELRAVEALNAEKAAARANAYAGTLAIEKAHEIRRRRKWRKRIDDRVHTVRNIRTDTRR